jgi:cytochrome P450
LTGGEPDAQAHGERIIAESLRLHPPLWLLTRRSYGPVRLADRSFPSGAKFLICPYVLQRDPRFWRDPETWNPDRHLDRPAMPGLAEGYIPFGVGKRQCAGRGIAGVIASVAVPALVARYVMRPADDSPVHPKAMTTLFPSRDITAHLSFAPFVGSHPSTGGGSVGAKPDAREGVAP